MRPAIVRVPLRGVVDALAATENVTAPFPLVFGPPPEVTVIHVALLTAVQRQPDGMVTATTREPPVASNDSDVDDTVAVQEAAPCVTVCRRPPMAMVPVRPVPVGLASTL